MVQDPTVDDISHQKYCYPPRPPEKQFAIEHLATFCDIPYCLLTSIGARTIHKMKILTGSFLFQFGVYSSLSRNSN